MHTEKEYYEALGLDAMPRVAARLATLLQQQKILAFYGNLGAGKTTLVRELCRQLGVKETVSSPSFGLLNEYRGAEGSRIYHFDFYRVKNLEEVYDIGYEDYFYSGHVCLLEWPEMVEELLPAELIRLYISYRDEGSRDIRLEWPA